MEGYHQSQPYRSYEATINTRALRYENFTIIYLWDDENLPSDKLIIEETEEGYLVDWEAFVVLQEMPWEEISKSRPKESQVIRARLKRLQNEHPTLTYAEGYLCYDIVHPTRPDLTFKGYFKKPTESSTENNDGLYTIAISCQTEATDDREVMIDEFVSKGWVIKQ